jgi:hypothetical protein
MTPLFDEKRIDRIGRFGSVPRPCRRAGSGAGLRG